MKEYVIDIWWFIFFIIIFERQCLNRFADVKWDKDTISVDSDDLNYGIELKKILFMNLSNATLSVLS